jgi:hypothetical protein
MNSQLGLPNNPMQRNPNPPNGKTMPEITAKWGTPAHLPPKPPTPQAVDALKYAGLPMTPKRSPNVALNGSGGRADGLPQA